MGVLRGSRVRPRAPAQAQLVSRSALVRAVVAKSRLVRFSPRSSVRVARPRAPGRSPRSRLPHSPLSDLPSPPRARPAMSSATGVDRRAQTEAALSQIRNRSTAPPPTIDFTLHVQDDGSTVSTTERVIKDVQAPEIGRAHV